MKKYALIILLLFLTLFIGCNKTNERIYINFIVEDKSYLVEINKADIITNEIIGIENKDDIVGIYYDESYTIEYNNEPLLKNTNLYVKMDTIIEVTFKLKTDEFKVEINKNEIIDEDILSKFTQINVQVIYYDSDYKQKYNNEPLVQDIVLYVKEETFENPISLDANLLPFSQRGSSSNDNTIIYTYEQFCDRYYYDEETKKACYERGFIYEEEFFEEKAIVLAYYHHHNMGNFIVINEVIRHNNKLTIKIYLSTGYMNSITNELILVEVNKKDVIGVEEIQLEKNVVDGQKVKVTYIIEGVEYCVNLQKLHGFSKEVIVANNEEFKIEDIEGLYLDEEYEVLYSKENLKNDFYIVTDTTIYVKLNK